MLSYLSIYVSMLAEVTSLPRAAEPSEPIARPQPARRSDGCTRIGSRNGLHVGVSYKTW